jgi:hypothetical protein
MPIVRIIHNLISILKNFNENSVHSAVEYPNQIMG